MTSPSETLSGPVPTKLREIADLPGPRGLPLLGNLLQIDRQHIHQHVERWVREYGPFFRFRLGRRQLLVIADHAAMGAVFRARPDGFRRTKRFSEIADELGSNVGVFGAEGEAWKRQRKMVMAGFDPRQLRAYFPSLVKVSQRLEARWRRAAEAQKSIDLQADLMRYTVDSVAGLAFGAEVNTLESDDDVIQRHLDKIFPALSRRMFAAVPTWRWWKSAADRELDHSIAEVSAAIHGFVQAARTRLEDAERRAAPRNLLEAMIVAADDPNSGITPGEVHANVLTMLLAGEDTTANTLAWAIWLLHKHPACLERARAEIDSTAGDWSTWTPEAFARLEYVDACASETLRLKPVVPFIMFQALRETSVAGIRVPHDALVFGALRSDSLRDEYFEHAARFNPDRWLGADAPPGATSANRIAMPFGAGPRVCPGRHLAMLEIKMALAVLLGHFELLGVTTASGGEPDERVSFTMAPEPLKLRLKPRR